MNRRAFVKGTLAAAASTALPLSITTPAHASLVVQRRVVRSFRPLGALAPQFAARFEGPSLDIVRRLYRGLLGETPSLMDLYFKARQWERNPTKTLRWFLRQPAFQSLTPVGADRIQYGPASRHLSQRHQNVALLRWAQVQKLWLVLNGTLPTPLEAMRIVAHLARVSHRAPQRLRRHARLQVTRAHAQGGTPGFSNPEGAVFGGEQAAAVMAEAQAQGLDEAQALAVTTALGAALAALGVGTEVALTLGGAIAAGEISGVFAISVVGGAAALTLAAGIGVGILLIAIAWQIDAPKGRGVDDAPPASSGSGAPPASPTAPPETVEGLPQNITITVTHTPTVSEPEANEPAVDESDGNNTDDSEGGAPGDPGGEGDGPGDAGDGGGDGSGGDGGGGDGGGGDGGGGDF